MSQNEDEQNSDSYSNCGQICIMMDSLRWRLKVKCEELVPKEKNLTQETVERWLSRSRDDRLVVPF